MDKKLKYKSLKIEKEIKSQADSLEDWKLIPDDNNIVLAISSLSAGGENPKLGQKLMLALLHDLPRQDTLPKTIVFYNDGVLLTCQESKVLSTLKLLEKQGTKILVCELSLEHNEATEKLAIGSLASVYQLNACFLTADCVIKP